jgi:hypothetical protein
MYKVLLIGVLALALAPASIALAEESESAEVTAEGEEDPGYVIREEKVINFESGKTETETVIEFPELEILPDVARPISIIIPRTEPDFDKMPFTIYNNEASLYLPEEYRKQYYNRIPVDDEVLTGDMYRLDGDEESEEGNGE